MRGVFTLSCVINDVLVPALAPKTLMFVGRLAATSGYVMFEVLGADVTNASQNVNEQIEIKIAKTQSFVAAGHTSSVAPVVSKDEDGDVDLGALLTSKSGNCSVDSYTYDAPIDQQGVPSLAGYHYQPLPEERPILSHGDGLGIILVNAPSVTFKCVVQLRLRAIGG